MLAHLKIPKRVLTFGTHAFQVFINLNMSNCPIIELGNKHLFDDALLAILLPFHAPRTDNQSVQASV